MKWFNYWKEFCYNWLVSLGMKPENIKMRDHSRRSCRTIQRDHRHRVSFPVRLGRVVGHRRRTVSTSGSIRTPGPEHGNVDPVTNGKFLPYCIEPSLGADRVALAFLCDAYDEEQLENETRVVLRLSPVLAPFKAAVLPLQKQLNDKAQEVYHMLLKDHMVDFDTTGSIGKRYRRQDEIGTPCCITIDFETLETNTVTVARPRHHAADPSGNRAAKRISL